MWTVTIDSVSIAELNDIQAKTGEDIWGGVSFDYKVLAEAFAGLVSLICPRADVEILPI